MSAFDAPPPLPVLSSSPPPLGNSFKDSIGASDSDEEGGHFGKYSLDEDDGPQAGYQEVAPRHQSKKVEPARAEYPSKNFRHETDEDPSRVSQEAEAVVSCEILSNGIVHDSSESLDIVDENTTLHTPHFQLESTPSAFTPSSPLESGDFHAHENVQCRIEAGDQYQTTSPEAETSRNETETVELTPELTETTTVISVDESTSLENPPHDSLRVQPGFEDCGTNLSSGEHVHVHQTEVDSESAKTVEPSAQFAFEFPVDTSAPADDWAAFSSESIEPQTLQLPATDNIQTQDSDFEDDFEDFQAAPTASLPSQPPPVVPSVVNPAFTSFEDFVLSAFVSDLLPKSETRSFSLSSTTSSASMTNTIRFWDKLKDLYDTDAVAFRWPSSTVRSAYLQTLNIDPTFTSTTKSDSMNLKANSKLGPHSSPHSLPSIQSSRSESGSAGILKPSVIQNGDHRHSEPSLNMKNPEPSSWMSSVAVPVQPSIPSPKTKQRDEISVIVGRLRNVDFMHSPTLVKKDLSRKPQSKF